MPLVCVKTRWDEITIFCDRCFQIGNNLFGVGGLRARVGPKQTVSIVFLVVVQRGWADCGSNVFKRWLIMSLVNYVLIGLLGTILGIALYTAKVDMSRDSKLGVVPAAGAIFRPA